MTPYDALYADQDLDEVLIATEFPPGSRLDVARSRMWEGKPLEAANAAQGAIDPWASLIMGHARYLAGQSGSRQLHLVAENADAESRARLWAWTALRKRGEKPSATFAGEVMGLVMEVPVDGALDVLAAYADGRARFLGHADQLVVFEVEEGVVLPTIVKALTQAQPLLNIPAAPRDKQSLDPGLDKVRLSALSANGVHRVEVDWDQVEKGGPYFPVFRQAMKVLQDITRV